MKGSLLWSRELKLNMLWCKKIKKLGDVNDKLLTAISNPQDCFRLTKLLLTKIVLVFLSALKNKWIASKFCDNSNAPFLINNHVTPIVATIPATVNDVLKFYLLQYRWTTWECYIQFELLTQNPKHLSNGNRFEKICHRKFFATIQLIVPRGKEPCHVANNHNRATLQ